MLDSQAVEESRSNLAMSGELTRSVLYNNVLNAANTIAGNGFAFIPTGSVSAFGGSRAPNGFLLCDGSMYDATVYRKLYSIIGLAYNLSPFEVYPQFRVPDLRGRTPFGKDDMGGAPQSRITYSGSLIDGKAIGGSGGNQFLQDHGHTKYDTGHGHTKYDPGHAHNYYYHRSLAGYGLTYPSAGNTVYIDDYGKAMSYEGSGLSVQSRATGITIANEGSGTTGSQNMPPAIIVNYIIKT